MFLAFRRNGVLYEFVSLIDYKNRIQLSKYIKNDIAGKLECSVKLVEKTLYQCVNKGLLLKLGTNTYLANPNIFGKGEWKNILKIVLTLTYDSKGRLQNLNKSYEDLEKNFISQVSEDSVEYRIKTN